MKDHYGIIYCATNLVNGRKYVGQTTRTLEDRKREHKNGICKSLIYHKINEYGIDNFKGEILCECYSREELNRVEKYYIDVLNSLAIENGYNIVKDSNQSCSHGWPSGKDHYLNQMSEKERNEGIKNNMCGENHSHRKHCETEEEYQRGLEENQRGKNNPTRKYKTEEEYQEWLDATRRSENHYTQRMTQEEYKIGVEKRRTVNKGECRPQEIKNKISKGQLNTEKGRKHKCVITLLSGEEYVTQSIRKFCNEYSEIYDIKPKLKRKKLSSIAKGERNKSERGFGCRFYNPEEDYDIPKGEKTKKSGEIPGGD